MCICAVFTLSYGDNSIIADDRQNENDNKMVQKSWDYSKIAFIAQITKNQEWSLCIMDSSGNNMHKIIETTIVCQTPVRSNFGTQLLFMAHTGGGIYGMYSVNTDGSGLNLIDRGHIGYATWSPDDKYIAYIKYPDHSWSSSKIILYNTSNKTSKVLNVTGKVKDYPNFSPNGQQIVYSATLPSDTIFMDSLRNYHIYKVDIDGKNNHLIINEALHPQWSPLGDKILYLSTGINGSFQISVANADGSNQQQLTSSVSPIWRDGNKDPHWTPDGQKIVYVSWENDKPEIFIMNADGSNKMCLTKEGVQNTNPTITPDGQYILFSSVRSGTRNNGICMMDLDGNNQCILYFTGIYPMVCK